MPTTDHDRRRAAHPQGPVRALATAAHELALPEPASGWRARLLALGLRKGVLAITLLSVAVSVLVTWIANVWVGNPEALWSDLTVGVVVPLIVAPIVSSGAMSLLFELERTRQQLYHAAVRDGLTQLYNRRFFMARLDGEVQRAWREGRPLAVLLIDLDHFKRINDGHGHATGDDVLERTAAALIEALRPYDLVARYGGEEFVALLPGTEQAAAMTVAERLRSAIAGLQMPQPPGGPALLVTASVGVGLLGPPGDSAQALLSRADRALYAAKHQGRNRCECEPSEALAAQELAAGR